MTSLKATNTAGLRICMQQIFWHLYSLTSAYIKPWDITKLVFFVCLSLCYFSNAQQKNIIRVKTFDQQRNPVPNITLSINGNEFISVGNKGIAFIEMQESELPPKSIKTKGNEHEVSSWNYGKGILEVIVTKKKNSLTTITLKNEKGEPIGNIKVKFHGKKTFRTTTNARGILEVPSSIGEEISEKGQFTIKGYKILKLLLQGPDKVIVVTSSKDLISADSLDWVNEKATADDHYFKDFDLHNLDSIQSLTVFYAVFKNYRIENLSENARKKIDLKFNELVKQLGAPTGRNVVFFMDKISDSSLVSNDVHYLLGQAKTESKILDAMRKEFDKKIELIMNKIKKDEAKTIDDSTRQVLLADINDLEEILGQNEKKFYRNQDNYKLILGSLKERLFNIKDLELKLSLSERRRLEEQKVFRMRMLTIFLVSLSLTVLVIGLLYLSNKLKKQKKELIKANDQVKSINEGLESLVSQRAKSLEEAHHEMDVFLYRASHDLRGPIRSIMGLYQIAKLTISAEGVSLFERVFQTARSMDRMLKKLQIINEINHPSNYSLVVLSEKIEDIRKEFADLITKQNITFEVDFPSDLSFYSYSNLVEVILLNLIENALFFSALKKQANPTVRVSAAIELDNVKIDIYDNGVGIDPDIHDKLWRMFFVGNENSTGNGIGLYIVRKSVEALRGHIFFESEKNVFTRFEITIPTSKFLENIKNIR